MPDVDGILGLAPVIPVLVVDDAGTAVTIAEALVEGGLPAIEVTLRTPAALDAIRSIKAVPGAIVGAGTVLDPEQIEAALAAGAEFLVSPGLTERLGHAAAAAGAPFLPGVASASEVMRALDLGITRLKYFPAEAAGGLPALAALASVFGGVRFCPTGGINAETAPRWLAHPAVDCVGGSWLAPRGEAFDRDLIVRRARVAAALRAA